MLRIETHAPGSYTISGYHPQARINQQGQTVVTHEVCQIVFAEDGQSNGVTAEILMDLIDLHFGGKPAQASAAPAGDDAKKQAMRDRMAAARAKKKTPDLVTA